MANKFNESQLKAINISNENIIVSASAGAGKTTVLIARLIKRIIEDHIKIDDIIAMTFTEASASEMKKRLLVALNEKLNEPNLDSETEKYLKEQLIDAETAHISTIHSFCLDIIKNNYGAIGLNPDAINNLIDDSDYNNYVNKASRVILKKYYENKPDEIIDLFNYLGIQAIYFDSFINTIKDIIKQMNNAIDPRKWIEEIINKQKTVTSMNDFDDEVKTYLKDYLYRHLSQCIDELSSLSVVEGKYQEMIVKSMNNLIEARQHVDNYEECYQYIIAAYEEKHSYRKPSSTMINKLYGNMIEKLDRPDHFIEYHNEVVPRISLILNMALEIYEEVQEYKRKDVCLDFNDLEHFAYQILVNNNGEVSKRYKNKYQEIMVDEFQDTNDIQNEIVNLVSNGHNVFRVGDIKQSIYRFRGAKPKIMQDILKSDGYAKIFLSNNYRSLKSIVEFNNQLFSSLMNVEGLSINYGPEDVQIADLPQQLENNEKVKYKILDYPYLGSDNQKVADFIAYDIGQNVINTQYKKYSDYCILVRKHSDKYYLKKAFDKYNLPYFIEDHSGFINSYSVLSVFSFMKFLDNNNDLVSLCALLTSSFYDMNEYELYKMLNNGKLEYLKAINHPLIKDLEKLKQLDLIDIINYILNINQFYENKINIQEKTNIDLFYNFAINKKNYTLGAFIKYINQIEYFNSDAAIPISDDDNVIKVMTIHQSKGLQFKYVYLMAKKSKEAMPKALTIQKNGVFMKYRDPKYRIYYPTLVNNFLLAQDQKDEAEENLRLFYVATTRSKDRLTIVDSLHYDKDDLPSLNYDLIVPKASFSSLLLSNIKTNEYLDVQVIDKFEQIENNNNVIKNVKDIKHANFITKKVERIKPSEHINGLMLSKFDFAKKGSAIHKAIELLPHKDINEEDIDALNLDINNYYKKAIMNLYHNDLFKESFNYENYHEYEFSSYVDKKLVTGIIDYISFGSEIMIVDFKSDRNKNEDELKSLYYNQLSIYHNFIQSCYPNKKINTYIYSLTLNKMIKVIG